MGLGKPQQQAKFEVASFSGCKNIKGKTPNLGNSPSPGPRPVFLLGETLLWALANPTSLPILKSLPSVVAEILKRNSKYWGVPLAYDHAHFFLCVMGLGKPKLYTKFEVASFSYCKNIKRELQNFWELS